jgi:glycosyltransferase involved in cell wall biosynthesis
LDAVPDSTCTRPQRTVLFLAYYFPPLGGGGVQRSISFVRHLPSLGYAPVVVTRGAAEAVEWGPVDGTLPIRIPGGVEVLRVPSHEPARSAGWRCRAERWLRIQEEFSRWWVEGAVETGRPEVDRADVIYASMSPFETGAAAAALAAEAGVPWVADLRDPWALDDWLVFPSVVHRRLELRTMRKLLGTAAAIVMNTPDARTALLECAPELRHASVVTIPNGFDAEEFSGPEPQRNDAVFRIVHAGHVHTRPEPAYVQLGRRALGGAASGLRVGTRSHLFVLQAIERLLDRRPDLRGTVELHLIGPCSEADRAALPEGLVRPHGYLSHERTVEMLRSADMLFLPMHELALGLRARIVPGKTYEYLAAGRPILAAVPDGDARDLLQRAGNAYVCRPSDSRAMEQAIEEELERRRRGEPPRAPRPEVLAPFERRELARSLAGVFDVVVGGREVEPEASRVGVVAR